MKSIPSRLLALLALTPCVFLAGALVAQEPATLVVTNAKVMTMDTRYPHADALAARGEWIVAVGTVEEVARFVGPDTRVIDAGGRLVIPGFNDAHAHFSGGANLLASLNLYGVDSLEEVLRLVKERVDAAAPGEWITGSRYDHTLWSAADDWPSKEDLDRVAPDNPVALTRASGHSTWANSMALEVSGITKDTPDPDAGQIQKDPVTGEPTGILLETAAGLLRIQRARPTPEAAATERRERFVNALRHAAELGITSIQSSAGGSDMDLMRQLRDEGALTLRFAGWLSLGAAGRYMEEGVRSGQGDFWVRTGMAKGFIDGTLGDGTAAMHEPFTDRPDFHGLPRMEQEELDSLVLQADRAGLQIGIHAIGDRGVTMVLDAYEKAALVNGTRGMRHRVEHAQLIKPTDLPRFGQLGVIPSMQPTHQTTDMRFAESRVGLERSKTAYAWRSLLQGGAILAFGTDWSVEPLDPMRGVFSAYTRTNIQEMEPVTGWFPEQKLSMWESVYYYTYGAAYGEHLENVKGTLVPGRLADLLILDGDLFTIPAAEILDTRVDYTVVGGAVVWDRAANRYGRQN